MIVGKSDGNQRLPGYQDWLPDAVREKSRQVKQLRSPANAGVW
jgi:hypothetical protein